MKPARTDSFWPSYTDLMTSLFFVMLVLFILVFVQQHKTIRDLQKRLAIITAVEENLKPLKNDSTLFTYEETYKRFKLAFDVKFKNDSSKITSTGLEKFEATIAKIGEAGDKLRILIDTLKNRKEADPRLRDVSYILVIAGYASRTSDGRGEFHNYDLSYQRALSLWDYWRKVKNIDFESRNYNGLIDLQIAGNGWGGVGRSDRNVENQRFLIQIFPKIGDIK